MIRSSHTLTIYADPVSWARPRRHGNRTFMDPRVEAARKRLAMHLRNLIHGPPDAEGRWKLVVHFACETRRRRDLDRLVSLVLDAATGVVYEDDHQVYEVEAGKEIGVRTLEGKTMIRFERIA